MAVPLLMACTDEFAAELYAIYQAGASLREVGAPHGMSSSVVQKLFSGRGWPRRPPRTPPSAMPGTERRKAVDQMKLASGCVDCGYNAHPAALHFDHRDPSTKLFRLSANLQRAWPVVLAEIAKCDVRCANCHAVRTAEQGYGPGRPRKHLAG